MISFTPYFLYIMHLAFNRMVNNEYIYIYITRKIDIIIRVLIRNIQKNNVQLKILLFYKVYSNHLFSFADLETLW